RTGAPLLFDSGLAITITPQGHPGRTFSPRLVATMAFAFRFVGYIVGGGILLALINPPPGPVSWAAVILYIVACAYIDAIGLRAARVPAGSRHSDGVVKMDAYRAGKHRAGAHAAGKPERRTPRPVFDTTIQAEAEGLLSLLRGKGLHPIM